MYLLQRIVCNKWWHIETEQDVLKESLVIPEITIKEGFQPEGVNK